MYQMKYTKNFKGTKGTAKGTQGIKIKPKKWVMERGQKVIWKRQRAQESRYKQERTLA
jgi:hypothetical protein